MQGTRRREHNGLKGIFRDIRRERERSECSLSRSNRLIGRFHQRKGRKGQLRVAYMQRQSGSVGRIYARTCQSGSVTAGVVGRLSLIGVPGEGGRRYADAPGEDKSVLS